MAGPEVSSIQEMISRLERTLLNGDEEGNTTPFHLMMAEQYLARLLQLDDFTENFSNSSENPSTSTSVLGHLLDPTLECRQCRAAQQARCHDCNEFLCSFCARRHQTDTQQLMEHYIEFFPQPIGSPRNSPPREMSLSNQRDSLVARNSSSSEEEPDVNLGQANIFFSVPPIYNESCQLPMTIPLYLNDQSKYCPHHRKSHTYVCINRRCRGMICSDCILFEHQGHVYMGITQFFSHCLQRVRNTIHLSTVGLNKIKGKIDEVLKIQYRFERDTVCLIENIERTFQAINTLPAGVIDIHLETIRKHKREKISILQDQMVHLKTTLSDFSDVCSNLHKLVLQGSSFDHTFVAKRYLSFETRLETLGENYKSIKPKNWYIFFSPPISGVNEVGSVFCSELGLLSWQDVKIQQIRALDSYVLRGQSAVDMARQIAISSGHFNSPLQGLKLPALSTLLSPSVSPPTSSSSQNGTVSAPLSNHQKSLSNLNLQRSISQNSHRTSNKNKRRTNASEESKFSPPSEEEINFTTPELIKSFGIEGKENGQVCRPWGICTDQQGNIILSDRRNHRVQVFKIDGTFLFAFGKEGDGDGEFQLPAGVCVDASNRIIVVDKDNHRVQIFTSNGKFLLKFGSPGKDRGQFQYPWGVAVNLKQQIAVSDSRNNRIQQFDSEGRFIRSFSFEFGLAKPSPRGIAYTSDGLLLVSDFDNHCLYLVDLERRAIRRTIGTEGATLQHFNRPSGISVNENGVIALADSKNQRVLILNDRLKAVWHAKIYNIVQPKNLALRDRISDVAFLPNNGLILISELSPDEKQPSEISKTFLHVIKLPEINLH